MEIEVGEDGRMRQGQEGARRAVVAAVLAGLLTLTGCTDDDPRAGAPDASATPTASASPSTPAPTGAPNPSGDPEAVPTPEDFVVTGVDCGLLDQRQASTTAPGTDPSAAPDDGFEAADLCIANALRTGQGATFRLVSESLEGDAVFARFAVEGPGRLTITEDHRAVVTSQVDERVKTCTEARSLSAQGNCTAREVARGTDG